MIGEQYPGEPLWRADIEADMQPIGTVAIAAFTDLPPGMQDHYNRQAIIMQNQINQGDN